eukprot:TRINITY_DN2840_c0_g1_i4.p2 TRINITY_DN2840_c0_g1~~TRINITY_DN2840_c0_g1_i4.p2  ORF type:complete len:157 (-),score=47.50 TRINITY_DN2840_c0_g1_i4:508-978(-)
MRENLALIQDINAQRDANRTTKHTLQAQVNELKRRGFGSAQRSASLNTPRSPIGTAAATAGSTPRGGDPGDGSYGGYATAGRTPRSPSREGEEDLMGQIGANRARIQELRDLIESLEGRMVSQRAYSKEILPPMDGLTPETMAALGIHAESSVEAS